MKNHPFCNFYLPKVLTGALPPPEEDGVLTDGADGVLLKVRVGA